MFDENISSFDTVENLASAGALPTVLASSAKAGLASRASEAVISTNLFMLSSSAKSFHRQCRTGGDVPSDRAENLRRGGVRLFVEPRSQRLGGIIRQERCERDGRLGARVALA